MAEKKDNGKMEVKDNQANTTVFKSLAPVESDSYSNYQDAFEYALSNDNKTVNITNIAVTGPYASGKSSVIEKVKNNFDKDKFITLSLTNFNSGSNEENTEKEENKKLEENLEAQLINQLIHKIDSNKIKDSRFLANKKIDTQDKEYTDKNNQYTNSILLAVILLIIINIDYDILINILQINDDNVIKGIHIIFGIIKIFAFLAFITTSIINFKPILFKLISLLRQRRILRKINIYGNEIELFSSEEESIFDKYTDEILYLFEKSGANIFIFEDIDRYEDVTIFKKLREINILLNDKIKRENNKKAPIKFIYIISDNMFTAEERTKFFDFIIPVVPYIHKGNAYDNLLSFFPDEIKDERNKKFLIKISLFIDNSRLIKNIANEYYIYNKFIKLKDREPHTKFIKLLSLIIYKNLFPKDFNQLYFNKGYLAELFNKEEFAKDNDIALDNLKYKTIKECIEINEDSNKFFKAPKGYDYIYNGGYFNLIKFLVANGYIDETYKDYMSEITENSLTYEERVFLQNIASHNGKQFITHLNRINEKMYLDNFLNFIDIEDLKRLEILNIYLLDNLVYYYIEDKKEKYKLIYETIYEYLIFKNNDYLFINYYYQYLISLYNITENINIELKPNNPYDSFIYLIIENYNILKINILDKNNSFSFVSVIFNILMVYKNNFINPSDTIKKEIEEIKLDLSINEIYILALEKNLTDDILFYYKHEHYNEKNLFNNFNIQTNNSFQLSIEDMDKEKWVTQDILNLLKETSIYLNNINTISSTEFFNLILNTQSFDVNYKNILYIAEYFNINMNMKYIENVFDTILNLQDKSLQKYIFSKFDNLIKTYYIIPNYNERIEIETYNKILESNLISDEHKELFKRKFIPYKL